MQLNDMQTFKTLFDSGPDARVVIDRSGTMQLVNRQTENLFGYERSELLGQKIEMLLPIRFREQHIPSRQSYFEDPHFRPMAAGTELLGLHRNGTEFTVEISLSHLELGGEIYASASIRDVTERRKMDARLKRFLESAPDAMVMIEREGNIILVNDQAERMFGYARAELLGQRIEILLPERFSKHHPAYREKYFVDPHTRPMGANLDLWGRRKDGTEFPVEISLSPVGIEQDMIVIAAVRDVSDRRKNEREREQLLRAIEQSPVSIVITDKHGLIEYVNPFFCHTTGYYSNEVIGQNPRILKSGVQTVEFYKKMWATILRGDEWRGEFHNKKKNGEVYWESVVISSVRDRQGRITHFIAVKEDISHKKKQEELLKETTQQLARSNEELEQFAYVASHDLQEPLRMVASYVQLLEKKYKDKLDDTASEYIAYAVDGARRMRQLIEDLLDYSRVQTQGRPFVEVNMEEVLDAALRNLSVRIEEKKAEISRGTLPAVHGDEGQIIRLLQNLIGNALKFQREDAIRVRVDAKEEKGRWIFSVADNGIGIEKEYQQKIFIIFKRLHTAAKFPGTGIGLAVCKRIVERHGGDIWVESTPGVGSTFYFTLSK